MSYAPLALTIPLAAVLLLLAVPAGMTAYRGWRGRLDRFGRLGLHTPGAQISDQGFAVANRVAAPVVAGAAAVGLACAVLLLVLPLGVVGAVVIAVVGLLGVLGQMWAGAALGERAARTVPVPARRREGGGCCGACGCGNGGCGNGGCDDGGSGDGGCGDGGCGDGGCGDGGCGDGGCGDGPGAQGCGDRGCGDGCRNAPAAAEPRAAAIPDLVPDATMSRQG